MITLKKMLFATLFSLPLLSGAAAAEQLVFHYVATVDYTDGTLSGVTVGTTFGGHFTYDPKAQGTVISPGYAIYSLDASSSIGALIGTHTATGHSLNGYVQNNSRSNIEDGISLGSNTPLVVDGAIYPNGTLNFVLSSKPGHTGVLHNTQLPKSYNVKAFDADRSLNYGVLQRDGSQTGTILQFHITSINVCKSAVCACDAD